MIPGMSLRVLLGLPALVAVFASTSIIKAQGGSTSTTTQVAAKSVIDVGSRKQLFLDDGYLIESSEGAQVVMNQPTKFAGNPVLRPDQPWEDVSFGLHGYIGVMYDERDKTFKMWHGVFAPTAAVAYAISRDGFHWTKPELGLVEWKGSRRNNLVIAGATVEGSGIKWAGACQVFVDGGEKDSAKRYKAVFKASKGTEAGRGVGFSADGIHWRFLPDLIAFEKGSYVSSAESNVFVDDRIGKYVRFSRMNAAEGRRAVGRSESFELMRGWSVPELALAPDKLDPPSLDFYSSGAFKYPETDNVYVMMLPVWDHSRAQLWLQLATSRDGCSWRRTGSRQPFVPLGAPRTWDSERIHPGIPAVVRGDQTFIYYVGHNVPEDLWGSKTGQIGVATLRAEGFFSLQAGKSRSDRPPWADSKGGVVTTKGLRFKGTRLEVNADVAGPWPENSVETLPELRVEILDENGRVIPGFDYEQCQPIRGDSVRHPVAWKNQRDLTSFHSRIIKLRFRMKFVKLYAFRFAE